MDAEMALDAAANLYSHEVYANAAWEDGDDSLLEEELTTPSHRLLQNPLFLGPGTPPYEI